MLKKFNVLVSGIGWRPSFLGLVMLWFTVLSDSLFFSSSSFGFLEESKFAVVLFLVKAFAVDGIFNLSVALPSCFSSFPILFKLSKTDFFPLGVLGMFLSST